MKMNLSSKSMTPLTSLRQEQEPYNITPLNSEDEDNVSTIQNTYDEKGSAITNMIQSEQQENQHQFDLYAPLTYEEADENQLAEFFETLDIDVSFG